MIKFIIDFDSGKYQTERGLSKLEPLVEKAEAFCYFRER